MRVPNVERRFTARGYQRTRAQQSGTRSRTASYRHRGRMTGTFFLLFALASAVALGTRLLKVPYTVALVVVGFVLGHTTHVNAPHLTRDLLFEVFLPGLLFEAAFHL